MRRHALLLRLLALLLAGQPAAAQFYSPFSYSPGSSAAQTYSAYGSTPLATTGTDQVVTANISSNATITFPPAAANAGKSIEVKRTDANTATLTLVPSGASGETLDGALATTVAVGGTSAHYVSDGTIWRLFSTYVPGTWYSLTDIISTKAGDTLTGPTSETAFASKYTVPANYLTIGQSIEITGYGSYTLGGAVTPTLVARLRYGTTELINTGSLTLPLSAGATYGYDFTMNMTMVSATQAFVTGRMEFQTANNGTGGVVEILVPGLVTIDPTTVKDITSTVVCSTANSTFKQMRFTVRTNKKPIAAN